MGYMADGRSSLYCDLQLGNTEAQARSTVTTYVYSGTGGNACGGPPFPPHVGIKMINSSQILDADALDRQTGAASGGSLRKQKNKGVI